MWWVVLLSGSPSVAAPVDAPPSLVDQELVPELERRRLAALARIDARMRFARGEAGFEEAWPRLDARTLGRADVLRGRLALLDDDAVARARQDAESWFGLDEQSTNRLGEALRAAHEAEARADELERGLLAFVLARLQGHPALDEGHLAGLRAPYERALAEVLPETADPEALAARARADVERQRLDALASALRLAGSGPSLPSPEEDLDRLHDPDQAEAAAVRLELLSPFLPVSRAAEVTTALIAHWYGRPLEDAVRRKAAAEAALASGGPPSAGEGTAGVEAARTALEAARAELEGSEAVGTSALGDALIAVRRARVEAAAAELALAEARSRVPSALDAAAARTEVQAAQEVAAAALAAAADARDRRRAEVLADYAAARERAASSAEEEARARARLDALATQVVDPEAELERRVDEVLELSQLDPRRPDPDRVHAQAREVLLALRDDPALFGAELLAAEAARREALQAVARDRERSVEARALLEDLEGEDHDRFGETIDSWGTVLDATVEAVEARVRAAAEERDLALSTLSRARTARRTLRPYLSRAQRDHDAAWYFSDVWQEISLLPPSVWLRLRERVAALRALPLATTDLNVLRNLVASSFWAVVTGVGWWWSRRQASPWSLLLAERVRRVFPELRPTDLRALREPTARLLRHAVDLALGPVLLWALGDTLPELRFLVGVWLYVAAFRAVTAGFELLVVRSTDARPALLLLRPETHGLARRTVRWFVGWFLVRRLADHLLWEVLELDRVSGTVDTAAWLAFWLGCAWTLFRWEPSMRDRVLRAESEGVVVRWLTKRDDHVLLRIPRAIGLLGLLAVSGVLELSHRFAREGTSLAWLFNVVGRYRLSEDEERHTPIDDALRVRLLEGADLRRRIERPELAALGESLREWREDHRRGLVALVGDRGTGKGVACDEAEEMLADAGLEVVRARLSGPLRTGAEVVAWLARVVGLPTAPADAEELVLALEAAPTRAFVLEDVHRCFARRVGGIEAIERLIYVLNATCDHQFWVVTFHGPAWDYFASVGSLVDTGVFHAIIRLAPLTSQQLRELTVGRAGRAGFKVDFSGLARRSAWVGGDPEVEQERAVGLFYRLLADASNGSPVVAMELFTRCLERAPDQEGTLGAFLGPALSLGVKADLPDPALFVLVALNLHGDLEESELVEVTNLPGEVVRATVRNLTSRGLVEQRDIVVRVPDELVPLVQRTLRRRHFLHLGGA